MLLPATQPPWAPQGRALDLPGRGHTWVHEPGGSRYAADGAGLPPSPGAPEPPTVFLLHGWTATAALNWRHQLDLLVDAGYRVVALDHRGHGRGIRTTDGPFTLEDCADDVAATAAELGIERAIVCGYSMGGPIAQLTWQRHPSLVAGLVLCATAATFRGRPNEAALFSVLGGLVRAVRHTPPRWQHQLHHRIVDRRFDDTPDGRWAEAEMDGHDPRSIVEAGIAIGRFDSRPWISEVDVPTAVVVTERDAVVPPFRQHALARAVPDAARFPTFGDHDVCVMQPGTFNPVLLDAIAHVAHRSAFRQLVAS